MGKMTSGLPLPPGSSCRFDADPLSVRPEEELSAVETPEGLVRRQHPSRRHFGSSMAPQDKRRWSVQHRH